MYNLVIKQDTLFKLQPIQSNQLGKDGFVTVKEDSRYPILAKIEDNKTNHIKFTLDGASISGKNTWWVFADHAYIEENVPRKPEVGTISFNPKYKQTNSGTPFKVPGISATLYSGNAIGKSTSFFWYEATHGLTRMPRTSQETAAIIRIAEAAQIARDRIGKPFIITSWFRPEPWNSRAGGASQSRHLYADAIDFYIEGMNTYQMYQAFDPWWSYGGVGKYSGLDICHLDARGYASRWYY